MSALTCKPAQEAERLLADDGRIVVCHFDWLALKGNVAWHTEELVLKYNPSAWSQQRCLPTELPRLTLLWSVCPEWAMGGSTGFYPQWTIDAAECGFRNIETFSFDVDVPYTHEGWRYGTDMLPRAHVRAGTAKTHHRLCAGAAFVRWVGSPLR